MVKTTTLPLMMTPPACYCPFDQLLPLQNLIRLPR